MLNAEWLDKFLDASLDDAVKMVAALAYRDERLSESTLWFLIGGLLGKTEALRAGSSTVEQPILNRSGGGSTPPQRAGLERT